MSCRILLSILYILYECKSQHSGLEYIEYECITYTCIEHQCEKFLVSEVLRLYNGN